MKKIYGFLLATAFAGLSYGQSNTIMTNPYQARLDQELNSASSKVTDDQLKFIMDHHKKGFTVNKAGQVSGYVNFVDAIDDFFQNQVLSGSFLSVFPDSTIVIQFSDGQGGFTYDYPFNHGAGSLLDPTYAEFYPNVFSLDDTIYIDSIFYQGLYFQNQQQNDKIELEIVVAPPIASQSGPFVNLQWNAGTFPNIPATETPTMTMTKYAGTTTDGYHQGILGTGSSVQKFTHDLTNADSGQTVIGFEVNLTLLPGEGLSTHFSFRPENGSYAPGDTSYLSTNKGPNIWRSFVVGNASTTDDNAYYLQHYSTTTCNAGQFLFSNTRYGSWPSNLSFLNDRTYPIPDLGNYVTYKVVGNSTSTVGIYDEESTGFEVKQNFPNPFNGVSFIDYTIAKTTSVTVQVFDITGKSVMTINEGVKDAGSYRVQLDGSNLKNGVYYYTFSTNEGQVTKKMMVQK